MTGNVQRLAVVPWHQAESWLNAARALVPTHQVKGSMLLDQDAGLSVLVSPPLSPSQQLVWNILARRLREQLGD